MNKKTPNKMIIDGKSIKQTKENLQKYCRELECKLKKMDKLILELHKKDNYILVLKNKLKYLKYGVKG